MICEKVYFPDEPLPDEFYLDVTLPEEIEYRNAESFVSENVWLWMVVFTVACYQRNYAIHSWLKSHCRAHFADDIDTPSLGFL